MCVRMCGMKNYLEVNDTGEVKAIQLSGMERQLSIRFSFPLAITAQMSTGRTATGMDSYNSRVLRRRWGDVLDRLGHLHQSSFLAVVCTGWTTAIISSTVCIVCSGLFNNRKSVKVKWQTEPNKSMQSLCPEAWSRHKNVSISKRLQDHLFLLVLVLPTALVIWKCLSSVFQGPSSSPCSPQGIYLSLAFKESYIFPVGVWKHCRTVWNMHVYVQRVY